MTNLLLAEPSSVIALTKAEITCKYTQIYCDGMPESRNSGIGSEVDSLCNELLRRLHENSQPIPR
jgi:hypothetical protein